MDAGERPLIVHTGEEVAVEMAQRRQAAADRAARDEAACQTRRKALGEAAQRRKEPGDVLPYAAREAFDRQATARMKRDAEVCKTVLAVVYMVLTALLWRELTLAHGLTAFFLLILAIPAIVALWLGFLVQCFLFGLFIRLKWPMWANILVTVVGGPLGAMGLIRLVVMMR